MVLPPSQTEINCFDTPTPTPPPQPDEQTDPDPLRYLTTILGDSGPHLAELRCLKKTVTGATISKQSWHPVSPSGYAALLRTAEKWSDKGFCIYVGTHARTEYEGGSNHHVHEFRTVYVDLDTNEGKPPDKHNPDKYPDAETALFAYEYAVQSGTLPEGTMVIWSGNGIHIYWKLTQPIPATPEGTRLYKAIQTGLIETLAGDRTVTDAARIMRLPGFANAKDPDNPKETSFESFKPELHYSPDAFPMGVCVDDYPGDAELPTEISGTLKTICEALTDKGHRLRTLKKGDAVKGVLFVDACPICHGQPEKYGTPEKRKAHIAPLSLRLKCKHATCAASDGHNGLPLAAWAPLLGIPSPHARKVNPTITLDDVDDVLPRMIAESSRLWLEGKAGVIQLPTGAGKTTATYSVLEQTVRNGRGAVLAVPSNALVEEKADEMRDKYSKLPIIEAVSLSHGCDRYEQIGKWGRLASGFEYNLCRKHCDQYASCKVYHWREQYKAHNGQCVLVCTHHMLRQIERLDGPAPAVVVIDELPKQIIDVRTWNARHIDNIANPKRGGTATEWFRERRHAAQFLAGVLSYCHEHRAKLAEKYAASKRRDYAFRIYGPQLDDVVRLVCDELKTTTEQALCYPRNDAPAFPASWDIDGGNLDDYAPLDVDDLVDGFDGCAVEIPAEDDDEQPSFHLLQTASIDAPEGVPVVFLDATGDLTAPIMEKAIGRPVSVTAYGIEEPHVKTVYYQTQAYIARKVKTQPRTVHNAAAKDLANIVKENPEGLYGIIGSKQFRERVWPDVAPTIKKRMGAFDHLPPLHYGNTKGTNQLETVDALVLFGAPVANIAATDYQAWRLGINPDDYRRWLYQAEMVQSIGRARGVRRDAENPLTVFIVGEHPPPCVDFELRKVPAGRPTDQTTDLVDELVGDLVDECGWCGPSMLHPETALNRMAVASRHHRHTKYLSVCQMCPNPDTMRKRVDRRMRIYARKHGLTERRLTNPDGTASIVVYERDPGAYERWLEQSGREPTEADPFPMPLVDVDDVLLAALLDCDTCDRCAVDDARPPPSTGKG